jgi:hypothetical protein
LISAVILILNTTVYLGKRSSPSWLNTVFVIHKLTKSHNIQIFYYSVWAIFQAKYRTVLSRGRLGYDFLGGIKDNSNKN